MQDTFKSKCKMSDMLLTFQHGNSQFPMIDKNQKKCLIFFNQIGMPFDTTATQKECFSMKG